MTEDTAGGATERSLVRLEYHEVEASPGFAPWLAEREASLAFTNGNRLFMVGTRDDRSLSIVERQFGSCTAIASVATDTLFLATRYQIWRLENALPPGETTPEGHDRLYLPQTAWTTGLLGVHDLAVADDGRIVFVNTRFSCLATVSETLNFEPLWVPPFISSLVPDDRCRLSGVVLVDGRPAYATSYSRADVRDGWREHVHGGGVVLAVPDGSVVAGGLSMPASPTVHDGRLWICNGGTGELGVIDATRGRFEPVAALPGVTRSFAISGDQAVVVTTRAKWGETFGGLPIQQRLAQTGTASVCGVFVVELSTGQVLHSLVVNGVAPDIGDVVVLPGVRSPKPVAFVGDEVESLVTIRCTPEATRVPSGHPRGAR